MALFLEITEGLNVGAKYRVIDGLKIGRSQGDILINDSKVSSKHAYIEYDDEKDLFELFDDGSSNGILINKNRVQKVSLMRGVVFQIGKTYFKVLEVEEEQVPDLGETKNWKISLKSGLAELDAENARSQVTPFVIDPPLKLEFIEGIQTEEVWYISFGPRLLGSNTLSLRLMDKEAPELAFKIVPTHDSIYFETPHPDKVLINNLQKSSEEISAGDIISFGETKIRISFE